MVKEIKRKSKEQVKEFVDKGESSTKKFKSMNVPFSEADYELLKSASTESDRSMLSLIRYAVKKESKQILKNSTETAQY